MEEDPSGSAKSAAASSSSPSIAAAGLSPVTPRRSVLARSVSADVPGSEKAARDSFMSLSGRPSLPQNEALAADAKVASVASPRMPRPGDLLDGIKRLKALRPFRQRKDSSQANGVDTAPATPTNKPDKPERDTGASRLGSRASGDGMAQDSAPRVPSVTAGPFLSASSMRLSGDETDSEGSEPGSPNQKYERLNHVLQELLRKEDEYERKLEFNRDALTAAEASREEDGQGKRPRSKQEEAHRKKIRKYEAKMAKLQERIRDARTDRNNCKMVADDRRPSRDHQLDVSHLKDAGRTIIAGMSSLTHRTGRRKKGGGSQEPSLSQMEGDVSEPPTRLNLPKRGPPSPPKPGTINEDHETTASSAPPTPAPASPRPPAASAVATNGLGDRSTRLTHTAEFGPSRFARLGNLADKVSFLCCHQNRQSAMGTLGFCPLARRRVLSHPRLVRCDGRSVLAAVAESTVAENIRT